MLIALDAETGRGSGRSIEAFDLLAGLGACAQHLRATAVTARPLAWRSSAGALEEFARRSSAHAERASTPAGHRPVERVDAVVAGEELGMALAEELQTLAPFGRGNPGVSLMVAGATFTDVRPWAKASMCASPSHSRGVRARAVAFGTGGVACRWTREERRPRRRSRSRSTSGTGSASRAWCSAARAPRPERVAVPGAEPRRASPRREAGSPPHARTAASGAARQARSAEPASQRDAEALVLSRTPCASTRFNPPRLSPTLRHGHRRRSRQPRPAGAVTDEIAVSAVADAVARQRGVRGAPCEPRYRSPAVALAAPTPALSASERRLLGDLFAIVSEHAADSAVEIDRDRVQDAFVFACEHHAAQRRKSGEDFIVHPVGVARICAGMRLDTETLCAALLHDTVEDTIGLDRGGARAFGEEIAELVDGVTKLTGITFQSREEAQAENYRKMMVAMANDVRVILIKLADRLHNMRTIDAMPKQKQIEKARETLEIYAPLAHRLGIHAIKWELEDLAFATLHPRKYQEIKGLVAQQRADRESYVARPASTCRASSPRSASRRRSPGAPSTSTRSTRR